MGEKMKETPEGLYEVHCSVCGARLGWYDLGSRGESIPCHRCNRELSFAVRDGETVVCCKQNKR